MHQVKIRWMGTDDIDDWSIMANALWPQLKVNEHRQEITTMIKKGSKRRGAIASTENFCLAGFADLGIRAYADGCTSQPVAYLEGIWVDASCRRMGVGEKLLTFLSDWAINEGFSEICSDTSIDNIDSHFAHAGWGFSETSKITNFRKELI